MCTKVKSLQPATHWRLGVEIMLVSLAITACISRPTAYPEATVATQNVIGTLVEPTQTTTNTHVVPSPIPTSSSIAVQSPLGRIYFRTRTDTGTDGDVYSINSDGTGLRKLLSLDPAYAWPALSWDAKQIAFVKSTDEGTLTVSDDVCIMNLDGTGLIRVTSSSYDSNPIWSPDGKRIAFVSSRDIGWDIYVINVDGSYLTRLTNNHAEERGLAWSPDGQRIAFHATNYDDQSPNADIFVIGADGSNLVNLTPDSHADDVYPAWSPDGASIAFASTRNGNSDIFRMNIDGTGVVRLTDNSASDGIPIWSPDGRQIAFQSNRDNNWSIYIMGANGSGLLRLTDSSLDVVLLAWLSIGG